MPLFSVCKMGVTAKWEVQAWKAPPVSGQPAWLLGDTGVGVFQGLKGGLQQEELEKQQKGKGWPGGAKKEEMGAEGGAGRRVESAGGRRRRGPPCISPQGYPVPAPAPASTSEGDKGRSEVAPGDISPRESGPQKKRRCYVAIQDVSGGVGKVGKLAAVPRAHRQLLFMVLGSLCCVVRLKFPGVFRDKKAPGLQVTNSSEKNDYVPINYIVKK